MVFPWFSYKKLWFSHEFFVNVYQAGVSTNQILGVKLKSPSWDNHNKQQE